MFGSTRETPESVSAEMHAVPGATRRGRTFRNHDGDDTFPDAVAEYLDLANVTELCLQRSAAADVFAAPRLGLDRGTGPAHSHARAGDGAQLPEAPPADEGRTMCTSVGSWGHASGFCRPCAFVRAEEGCKFGAMCTFCHAAGHDDYVRARPCRAKRQRLRRVIAKI